MPPFLNQLFSLLDRLFLVLDRQVVAVCVIMYTRAAVCPILLLTTIDHCSFPVAASIIWNTLPVHVCLSYVCARA